MISEDVPRTLTRSCLHVIPNAASPKHVPIGREKDKNMKGEKWPERTSKVPASSWVKNQKLSQELGKVVHDESEALSCPYNANESLEENCKDILHPLLNKGMQTSHAWCMNFCRPSCQDTVGASEVVTKLLDRHPGNIPFHNSHFYMARAACTRSIPDFRVLAFPDFWGHQPLPYSQPLLQRRCGVQK